MSEMPTKPIRPEISYKTPIWAHYNGVENLTVQIGSVTEDFYSRNDFDDPKYTQLLGLLDIPLDGDCDDEPWYPDIPLEVLEKFSELYGCVRSTVRIAFHASSFELHMFIGGTILHSEEECKIVLEKEEQAKLEHREV